MELINEEKWIVVNRLNARFSPRNTSEDVLCLNQQTLPWGIFNLSRVSSSHCDYKGGESMFGE
jgi:hypothetical protein